jgi:hypothetical protein
MEIVVISDCTQMVIWVLKVGKMANFSILNAIASVAGPNAICGEFDGEGKVFSCRLKYNWQECRSYRMRIWYERHGW